MKVAVLNDHIFLNDEGVPMIKGTTTKVVEVVMDVKAYGWSPEEIHYQHQYLSMAQIHSALAYYWDHRQEIEDDIRARSEFVEEMRKFFKPYSIRPLLERKGLI